MSASDYVIEIFNNVLQPDHVTMQDEFVVLFSSGLTPPIASQLIVNGTVEHWPA